jgi:hypothetical protein
MAIFAEFFDVFGASVEVGGSAWKWLNGGPCSIWTVPPVFVRIKLK